MAVLYVKNTGSNTAPYDTWAKAATTLGTAIAASSAGDTIWVSHQHAETSASSINYGAVGTYTATTRILCGNDGAQPPTALATTATITTTGTSNIAFTDTNSFVYVYGITFFVGTGSGNVRMDMYQLEYGYFEQCSFRMVATGVGSQINVGCTVWKNCTVKFGAAYTDVIACNVSGGGGTFHWKSGSILSGSSSPVTMFTCGWEGQRTLVENVDFSNLGTTWNFVDTNLKGHICTMRNCKLPASWTGAIGTPNVDFAADFYEMVNSDSSGTTYVLRQAGPRGTVAHETTLVRTGGASISWKVASYSSCKDTVSACFTPEIVELVESGSAVTATVEILHDSATNLTNAEIYMRMDYLGNASYPLGTMATTECDKATTPTDVAASSAVWTTTGMSNPNKQKLAITFTPQLRGLIYVRVYLAKASKTVYIDPKITLQ